ncbi:MAG TPA: hypothetical protein VMU32_11980 [Solirubrobacteraceae bacterium]|nr:hypothetical protein [Solirubrobacteraceae bacterium]
MSALLVCWVAFPVLLGLLAQGCGTLLARLAGRPLAPGVRIPCGVALVIAVLDLFTRAPATAPLAVPAVLALGGLGLVLHPPWRWTLGPAAPALTAATAVFAVYAAPVVLSGMATWTGYIKLDDTATWLALVDRALAHGRTIAGLPPSSYRATLSSYLTVGYPIGSFLPMGIGRAVLGEDIAWLVNPWMAFLAATLALALQRIAALCLGTARWTAAAIAALAAQPALLYGYYLWGGIKEVAGALLIGAFAVAAPPALTGAKRLRTLIPAAVVVWALIATQSPGGLVWVGPGGLLAIALWGLRDTPRLRRPAWPAVALALALVAGGVYLVLRPRGFVERFQGVLTGGDELGNLVKPLRFAQIAGIWPTGDFRFAPSATAVTAVLIGLVAVGAVAGLLLALRKRRHELVLYVSCAVVGAALVDLAAAPWLGAKALASASPALPLAVLSALAMGWQRRAGVRALAVGAPLAGCAIALGVAWSNVLAYHDVSLAPRAQFAELAEIGRRIAGRGPTLMTEYQPYGTRHFLREAAPEGASELREREDPLISGALLEKGQSADVDQIRLSSVLAYRTLVLQRSPVSSRPPSPYRLTLRDSFWEVWQRPSRPRPDLLWHLPLGDAEDPGSVPRCATVLRLARRAGVHTLLGAPVENPVVAQLADGTHPAGWSTGTSRLAPDAPGTARIALAVPRSGRYAVWLGGSTRGPLAVAIDGRRVGTALLEIQEPGQYIRLGELRLGAGRHSVALSYRRELWRPGTGGPPEAIGPLVLSRVAPPPPLLALPANRARELCGRTLDWIEGLGAG